MKQPPTHKIPAEIVWLRKLATWIGGAPISASKGSLRMEGDTIHHRETGDIQARRHSTGHIFYRARGIAESANPTNFQVAGHIASVAEGKREITKWGSVPGEHYPSGQPRWGLINLGTHEWEIPRNMHLCTPVPGILLTLSSVRPLSPDLVDLGTMLEWTRVQAIIKSRSKQIRADGSMPYFAKRLASSAEEDNDVGYRHWNVDLASLNKVRAIFGIDQLPSYESPIDGLPLADFKNLHALAASA
jgi:hypothetical protein